MSEPHNEFQDTITEAILQLFKEEFDLEFEINYGLALTWLSAKNDKLGAIYSRLYFADEFVAYYKRPDGVNAVIFYSDPDFLDKVREWVKEEYKVKLQ